MSTLARTLLIFIALATVERVHAGSFHRCDDGSGTSIYQTVPCAAGVRTVAQREFPEPAPASSAPKPRTQESQSRKDRVPRQTGSRASTARRAGSAPAVAYACTLGTEQWVQSRPCASSSAGRLERTASRASGGKPRQRPLTRAEVCRKVRDGSYRSAHGERVADSSYQRNLMRDRGGC